METQVNYINEISMMMYGFGDSHKPNPDTVRLVDNITMNQLRLIVQEAQKVVEFCRASNEDRSSSRKEISSRELVFLMRKNKHKMCRFVKYLRNKYTHKKLDSKLGERTEICEKSPLLDFIEYIDETGELTNVNEYDEIKLQRMLRAERISQSLDEENYLKFSKARGYSFVSKSMSQLRNFQKLKQWIDPQGEYIFSDCCFDVLSYYAYETVALLTDYALLVRMDRNRKLDPFGNLPGTHYSASMFNIKHNLSSDKPDYSTVYHGQPPISVAEIKEVMRRLRSPQVGRLNFGVKVLPGKQIIAI